MPHRNANHCSQELLVPEAMVCISAVRLRWRSGQFIPRHLASGWSVLKSPASLAMKRRCGIAEQRRRDLGLGEPGDVRHRLLPDRGLKTFRHQRTAVSDHGDVLDDAVGGRVPGDRYGLPIQDNDSLSEGHCPRCLHGGTQFTDCCRDAENAVRKGECTHVQDINRIFQPICPALLLMPVASGGTFGGIRISASMPEALSLPADAAPVPCPAQDLADKAPGDAVWASGRPASWQRLLLGLALLKRLLDLAHHGRLDLVEVCLDGVATGLRLGSGHRHLLGLGPVDGHSRLGEEAAVQRIDQAVESRIGQRDLLLIVEPSQGHGLMGVPRSAVTSGPNHSSGRNPLASPLEASSTMTRCRKISSTRA